MVCRSIGLSVTVVSLAKIAELIEMPFGLRTWVGSSNHVLDRGQIPTQRDNLRVKGAARSKLQAFSAVSCAKAAESFDMPFGMLNGEGTRKACVRRGLQIRHANIVNGNFEGKGVTHCTV